MATLSVSVPTELKEKMSIFDEINWSAVARKAFEAKLNELEFLKELAKKSKLSSKDAQDIGNKINKDMAKKFKEMK